MPASTGGDGLNVGSAVFWSLTWSVGIAIGVALGGWLTVVGGSGAPGVTSLDVTHDLIVVPLLSGLVAFIVLLVARVLVALVRRGAA